MESAFDNPKNPRIQMIFKSEKNTDYIEYLDFMTDFYFKVMIVLSNVQFKSPFKAQMTSSLQMMFTKGKAIRTLVEGNIQSYRKCQLYYKADHTILFSLVRAAYEQLCVFELIYMIPDTEEKRSVMENIYIAAGEVNRQKMITEESFTKNPDKLAIVQQTIDDCKAVIHKSTLYLSLTQAEKNLLDETVFKKGKYQVIFTNDGKFKSHVNWDEVRDYCRLRTDALNGVYRYACNMAHPSYLGLIQFHDSFKDGSIDELNDTAIMQMISIMSVFIMDFMEEYPEAKQEFDKLDEEEQFTVRLYSDIFRNRSVE